MTKRIAYSLIAFMSASVAHAAVTVTPASEWTVAPIGVKSDNGLRFCSLKTSYSSGQGLVFARDNQGNNSLAVDFKRDAFTVGRQYPVDLTTGKVSRRLSALASSAQIIVLQTGVDTALYAALRAGHEMTLDIEGASYAYNLDVSFADGLAALEKCTESLNSADGFDLKVLPLGKTAQKQTAEAQEAAPAPQAQEEEAAAPAPVKKKTAKKSRAKDAPSYEATRLRAEKARLEADLRQQQKREKDSSEVEGLRAEVARLSAELQQKKAAPEADTRLAAEALRQEMHQEMRQQSAPAATPAAAQPIALTAPEYAPARVRELLLKSKTIPAAALKPVDDQGVLRWTDNGVNGAAQAETLAGKDFPALAQERIASFKKICKGSFAARVGTPRKSGSAELIDADISCIDGRNDAGAALLFVQQEGRVISVTQESAIDQVDAAMVSRDNLAASIN